MCGSKCVWDSRESSSPHSKIDLEIYGGKSFCLSQAEEAWQVRLRFNERIVPETNGGIWL